jgi:hypothetical protein
MATDSIRQVIHKKRKEAKEKNTKEHLSNVQMNICTNGKGSTQESIVNSTNDTNDASGQDIPPSFVQQRKDIELDYYLHGLIAEGLVDRKFMAWHCRAVGVLTLYRYNLIVLNVREAVQRGQDGRGKPIRQPAYLLSSKVKGMLQLEAKHQFYSEGADGR